MRVLLLFPPITVSKGSVKKCDLPLGLAYIAAYLEKGDHDVHCLDISMEGYENEREHGGKITFGLGNEEIKRRIGEIAPELVGISCPYSLQFHNLVHVSKLVKEVSNAPVAVGGVHATFGAGEILGNIKSVDIIVMGEGEATFLDLANRKPLSEVDGIAYRKGGKVKVNKKRALIKNIDDIPFPARHLFDMERYIKINKPHNHFPKRDRVASILTSRGCSGHCTFCSSHLFWGSCIRYRSVDNIIWELKELAEKYGVQEIQILDDNLTGWPQRAKELFRRMKDLDIVWCTPNGVRIDTIDREMLRLMKESGCYRITYALESGDEHILHDVIKKPYDLSKAKPIFDLTKKMGMGVHAFWVIGFPGETREQIWKTFNFAKSLKTESASFCLATPMIGTELLQMCQERNLLRDGFDVSSAHYRETYIKNPNISKEELEKLCDYFNNEINKGLLWRNPIAFFKKYHRAMLKNPKGIFNIFTKYG